MTSKKQAFTHGRYNVVNPSPETKGTLKTFFCRNFHCKHCTCTWNAAENKPASNDSTQQNSKPDVLYNYRHPSVGPAGTSSLHEIPSRQAGPNSYQQQFGSTERRESTPQRTYPGNPVPNNPNLRRSKSTREDEQQSETEDVNFVNYRESQKDDSRVLERSRGLFKGSMEPVHATEDRVVEDEHVGKPSRGLFPSRMEAADNENEAKISNVSTRAAKRLEFFNESSIRPSRDGVLNKMASISREEEEGVEKSWHPSATSHVRQASGSRSLPAHHTTKPYLENGTSFTSSVNATDGRTQQQTTACHQTDCDQLHNVSTTTSSDGASDEADCGLPEEPVRSGTHCITNSYERRTSCSGSLPVLPSANSCIASDTNFTSSADAIDGRTQFQTTACQADFDQLQHGSQEPSVVGSTIYHPLSAGTCVTLNVNDWRRGQKQIMTQHADTNLYLEKDRGYGQPETAGKIIEDGQATCDVCGIHLPPRQVPNEDADIVDDIITSMAFLNVGSSDYAPQPAPSIHDSDHMCWENTQEETDDNQSQDSFVVLDDSEIESSASGYYELIQHVSECQELVDSILSGATNIHEKQLESNRLLAGKQAKDQILNEEASGSSVNLHSYGKGIPEKESVWLKLPADDEVPMDTAQSGNQDFSTIQNSKSYTIRVTRL